MADTGRTTRVIAVEEAYGSESWIREINQVLAPEGERQEQNYMSMIMEQPPLRRGLTDVQHRLDLMDQAGVDMHVLSLNTPGVQMHEARRAGELAAGYNDELSRIVGQNPGRFAGLGTIAPQDPAAAATEVERAVQTLGLNGILINSHTFGHYLDEPQFDPILTALEAADAPLYLHPRVPSPQAIGPTQDYGLFAALWGFAVEGAVHALRLIMSGAFDRHPRLRVILGHAGEGLPYWTYRLDHMHNVTWELAGPVLGMHQLELTPSEYLRRNFAITTSGMNDPDVLGFCLDRLGDDNVMFAIDYPYEDMAKATTFLADAPLTAHRRALVSHRNAERIFGIPPAKG